MCALLLTGKKLQLVRKLFLTSNQADAISNCDCTNRASEKQTCYIFHAICCLQLQEKSRQRVIQACNTEEVQRHQKLR